MGNAIYATSALALAGAMAAGPASAADMLSMGIGGYMEQWVGMSSTDDSDKASNNKGGMAQRSDSEIYITGSLESDSGLKFAVKFELEGENGSSKDDKNKGNVNQVDESRMTISGSFGEIWLGSDDVAATSMHAGHVDVGIGLNHGDVGGWIKGAGTGLGTAGTHADQRHIAYYTPRINGLHVGVSYVPDADSGQATSGAAPTGQENSGWSAGLNFKGDLGGSSVTFSLGHIQTETTPKSYTATTGDGVALNIFRTGDGTANTFADDATEMMMKGDDKTFSNAGLQVGFGAFGFNVAYAAIDGGAYKQMNYAKYTGEADAQEDQPDMLTAEEYATGAAATAAGVGNDESVYTIMQKAVKDTSMDRNVVSVGMVYSEGPMSVSLGHMINDRDDGTDSSASMLSASYTLAPGVAWKSSLFTADDNTEGKGHEVEGNGFVTGVKINF